MAEKIKTNTIESQIDLIDKTIESATGINLKERAEQALRRQSAVRQLGIMIAKAVAFDGHDGSLVLVRGGMMPETIH